MHCYRCGIALREDERHLRRKIQTGELVRHEPGRRARPAASRYGLRVVCARCARLIDFGSGRLELVENLKLALAMAVLVAMGLFALLTR